jgi:hypothetical protein
MSRFTKDQLEADPERNPYVGREPRFMPLFCMMEHLGVTGLQPIIKFKSVIRLTVQVAA